VKTRLLVTIFAVLAAVILLAGCSAPAAPTATPVPPTNTPVPPTSTPEPTLTPTPEPTFTPTATLPPAGCADTQGKIERISFQSATMTEPLWVRIYYPPCYSTTPAKPYPVLIMIHGQTYNDDQWERLGMTAAADRMIVSGEIPPFLLFMPLEKDTSVDAEFSNFDQVVVNDLLPWIDANFPTCTLRECRGVGGLSRGANWAVYIAFKYPDLFGSIGAHSYTSFYADVWRVKNWMKVVTVEQLPRMLFDIGDTDIWLPYATDFTNEMRKFNINFEWLVTPGKHEEAYWIQRVGEYLLWYAAVWPE
jgi:enterochelin esterase-like enzyme